MALITGSEEVVKRVIDTWIVNHTNRTFNISYKAHLFGKDMF